MRKTIIKTARYRSAIDCDAHQFPGFIMYSVKPEKPHRPTMVSMVCADEITGLITSDGPQINALRHLSPLPARADGVGWYLCLLKAVR